MAGEIEEPFSLDFRVDSFRSGSISFGRFETEALCWERRSSVSHNRYLEEVEKCSKPGSVTEKKAYFEAHFRKKGFPVPSSPECRNDTDYQTSENDTSEKMCNDEEIDHLNASSRSAQFDESWDGSVHGGNHEVTECETEALLRTSFSEPQHASDSTSNVKCIPEHVKVDKADAELGSSLSINFESGIEIKENLESKTASFGKSHESNIIIGLSPDNYANEENSNVSPKGQQTSSPKEKVPSKSDPRLVPRVSVGQSRRYTSGSTSKCSENKATKVRNVPVRSKAEKKSSEDPNKCLMHKTTKYERGLKTKGVDDRNSAPKQPRNRTIVEAQSSLSQRASSRVYQSANRVKPAVGVTKPGTRQDISRSSFKSNDRSQRRKEFDMKLESTMHAKEAERHQRRAETPEKTQTATNLSRRSLSFKASCHATVTTDSRTSSPAATIRHQPSQAGISPTNRKKELPEKEKLISLRKHKVPEGNQIHKGKTFDGKEKMRIGRSSFASFNSSSRTSHMAVRVAS